MTDKKKYELVISDRAKQDLQAIYDYILINFYSQQAVASKIDLILKALEILELFPEVCPLVSSRGFGNLTVDGKPYRYMPIEHYLVFYFIEGYQVFVARILHSKQNWITLLK
ncbi:type II toxin-antitoxin system RelE/ParE family toxin [Streptococcus suis]|uniref:type II toxin-antitoxin system RelE/ParE family toxin n=1 Tax=Streptococcus suis TaxID=1307 RepID=UPI00201AE607|nr:type II toxin-antitoxin system RelE/ParE family toxin [Streptococcus suis]MCL4934776.1 type II toxin-antitoxin system RelE/ParE family toxin [Streptococcus suis]